MAVQNKNPKSSSKPVVAAAAPTRKRKLGRKQKKKVVRTAAKLPSSHRILGRSLKHIWRHKKIFTAVFLLYLLLYVVMVRGVAMDFQLSDARATVEETLGTSGGTVQTASSMFGVLLSSAGATTSEAAGVYQMILFVIFSLVIIWLLRATYENRASITLRQAFYKSSYPLVPYLLVGMVLVLHALPALIALSLYSTVMDFTLFVGALEQIVWTTVLLIGLGASLYMLSSSFFASYIVTLPDMTPKSALRSAKKLVKYRRWPVIRKVLFLPFIFLLFLGLIFMPMVLVAPQAAEVLFMLVSLSGLFVLHTYFYTLYRELL